MSSQQSSAGPFNAAFLERLKAGDESAWMQFYQENVESLHRFISRQIRDATAVEDIVQETFMAAVNEIQHIGGQFTFKTYLFALARRGMADYWRQQKQLVLPEVETNAGEFSVELQEALRELPPRERQVLVLRYHIGLSIEEIDELMDHAPTATESLLTRGVARLAGHIPTTITKGAFDVSSAEADAIENSQAIQFDPRIAEPQGESSSDRGMSRYPAAHRMLTPLVHDLYIQQYMCEFCGRDAEAAIFGKYATIVANLGRVQDSTKQG